MSYGPGWADALADRLAGGERSPQPQRYARREREAGGPRVTALSVAPIKGTRLQTVDAIELTRTGARGDRRFFVIDERDRMVNGKTLGELQGVVAAYGEASQWLELTLPDGQVVEGRATAGGQPVDIKFYSSERPVRVVAGPWNDALSEVAGQPLRLVDGGPAMDRGADGAVSLISRGSLDQLALEAGVDRVDARRFRMLIEVDGVRAHEEDRWVGRTMRVGSAALVQFVGHVGRCLITSRDPDSGEIDLPTLDVLRGYRGEMETTEPLPFGIHGRVLERGRVAVGDTLTPVSDEELAAQ